MPTPIPRADRAPRPVPSGMDAFRREQKFSLRSPLRALAAFMVVGAACRFVLLSAAKDSFEEERARQEARDEAENAALARRVAQRAGVGVDYTRVWKRVFEIEARLAAEEGAAAAAAAAAVPAPALA